METYFYTGPMPVVLGDAMDCGFDSVVATSTELELGETNSDYLKRWYLCRNTNQPASQMAYLLHLHKQTNTRLSHYCNLTFCLQQREVHRLNVTAHFASVPSQNSANPASRNVAPKLNLSARSSCSMLRTSTLPTMRCSLLTGSTLIPVLD